MLWGVKTLPYPTAAKGLTPKTVRDALKRLPWEKLTWWSCPDKALREHLAAAKKYFRDLTIADVAEPKQWALVSARRVGDRVLLDASLIFGALLTQKQEHVRFRLDGEVVTVERARLDDFVAIMRSMVEVSAAIAPKPYNRGGVCLSIRWTRGNGRVGGLDLWGDDGIHDSWCTVVELPEPAEASPSMGLASEVSPEWASPVAIAAALARQEAERRAPRAEVA
jgi:hypothetical protein